MKYLLKQPYRKRVEDWVTALRSGQFVQGRERLKCPDGSFCCLGVACQVSAISDWDAQGCYLGDKCALPSEIKDYYGTATSSGGRRSNLKSLVGLNDEDEGATFAVIADVIEAAAVDPDDGLFRRDLFIPDLRSLKPSELLDLAVKDLKAVEDADGYEVNMSYYHAYRPNVGVCEVCLAGSVMVQSCGVSRTMSGSDVFDIFGKQYRALDSFRCGAVSEALWLLDCDIPGGLMGWFEVPGYDVDRDGFFKALDALILKLKEFSL